VHLAPERVGVAGTFIMACKSDSRCKFANPAWGPDSHSHNLRFLCLPLAVVLVASTAAAAVTRTQPYTPTNASSSPLPHFHGIFVALTESTANWTCSSGQWRVYTWNVACLRLHVGHRPEPCGKACTVTARAWVSSKREACPRKRRGSAREREQPGQWGIIWLVEYEVTGAQQRTHRAEGVTLT
jgi:hypothetical protein